MRLAPPTIYKDGNDSDENANHSNDHKPHGYVGRETNCHKYNHTGKTDEACGNASSDNLVNLICWISWASLIFIKIHLFAHFAKNHHGKKYKQWGEYDEIEQAIDCIIHELIQLSARPLSVVSRLLTSILFWATLAVQVAKGLVGIGVLLIYRCSQAAPNGVAFFMVGRMGPRERAVPVSGNANPVRPATRDWRFCGWFIQLTYRRATI